MGVHPANYVLCSCGCGQDEMINHLFSKNDFFGSIWHRIHRWLGI